MRAKDGKQPKQQSGQSAEDQRQLSHLEAQIKQLQAQLNKREMQLQVLHELTTDWYWEQDKDFRFTTMALSATAGMQLLVEECIGKTRWELAYIEMSDEAWRQHRAVLDAHLPFRNMLLKWRDATGRFRFNEISGIPAFDESGEFIGYRGIGKDVTERVQAEKRAAMDQQVMRLLADADDLSIAIPAIIRIICEELEWDYGAFWSIDKHSGTLRQLHVWHMPSLDADLIADFRRHMTSSTPVRNLEKGTKDGILRQSWAAQEPVWMTEVAQEPDFRRAPAASRAGLHSAVAFPIVANSESIGAMELYSREVRHPDAAMMQSLRSIGSQIGLFYQRKQTEARQAMEHSVTRLLAEAGSIEQVMPDIIRTICETLGWDYGCYWSAEEASRAVRCTATWKFSTLDLPEIISYASDQTFSIDALAAQDACPLHRVWLTGEPVWLTELAAELDSARAGRAVQKGLQSAFAFPVLDGKEVMGALEFFSPAIRHPDTALIDIARSIGLQIGQFCRRKRAEQRLQYLAYYDGLTGLPNRTHFQQSLKHALAVARRNQKKMALLFIDLDRFKNINDTLGHLAGDTLLEEVAKRFRDCLRESDTVARLGGDEFVVLLEDVADPEHAASVARKILRAALHPFVINEGEYHISASVGISIFPEDGEDDQTLMKHADIAMYTAKEHGKNNYQFYSVHSNANSFERLVLESSLRRALEREEFSLHYQAKVDLKTGSVTGMEALLRWNHPDLGMISPAHFIPVAEESGLIVPIGRWVINEACKQNKAWQDQGLPALPVAVNLSARQFTDDSLLQIVAQALQQSGLAPQWLELEVTESMVMYNPDRAVKLLSELKERGISIAIDDFGNGYSSLSQLKRFPINTIKIDRSFIKDLIESKEDAAITSAIIAMGNNLSLNVIAEGVETTEQVGFLKDHQCDEMQGYYFSKPISGDDFAELLRTGKMLEHESPKKG